MNTEMQRHLFAPLVRGLLVCLLGSYGITAATAANEVEPNDAFNLNAPPLGLDISGTIGPVGQSPDDLTSDVDLFTFDSAHDARP